MDALPRQFTGAVENFVGILSVQNASTLIGVTQENEVDLIPYLKVLTKRGNDTDSHFGPVA